MKKYSLMASLVIISESIFASPEGLLHGVDSSRSQSGMRNISEVQIEALNLPQRLRKRERVTYVQSDSWPQEEDNSQDSDYVCSSIDISDTSSQRKEEEIVSVNSPEDLFEDVLASREFDSRRYNLREHPEVIYVQPSGSGYSQFPEQDNPQDPDYIPSQNINDLEEASSSNFVGDSHELTGQVQEIDLSQSFSSPNKKLKLNLNRNYYDKKLNLINNRDFLKKYRNFDNVENLVLTVGDLKDANKFKFPNLKELNIDILIKQAKPKKIGDSKKRNLRQLVLEEIFSKKNQRKLRNHRLEKECKDAAEKRLSKINKKKLTKQLLSEELPTLLSGIPNIKKFSIQHIDSENLPIEIWNLKELRSLTLKMIGMTELSSEVQNLINLEILDLSNNKIKTLPEELSNLNSLRELNLVGNFFMEELPNVLEQLPNLEQLHIDYHQSNLWKNQLQKLQRINKNLKIEVW